MDENPVVENQAMGHGHHPFQITRPIFSIQFTIGIRITVETLLSTGHQPIETWGPGFGSILFDAIQSPIFVVAANDECIGTFLCNSNDHP